MWAISDGSANSNWATDPSGLPAFATSQTPGPGTTINFSAVGAADEGSMVLGANMSIQGIVVNDTNPVGLNNDGNTLTIDAGGITVNSGAGAVALSPTIVLSAPQTWTNNSNSTLSVGTSATSVNNGANLLTIAGSGATSITNFNGGTGGLTVSNSGGASNPAVTLAGTISLYGAQTWTNNSSNPLTASGAIVNGGNLLTIAGTGNVALSGTISGIGGLTASGSGVVTLSSTNTYSGATTVAAGTLVAGNTAALGFGTATLSGGTLRVTAPGGITTISGFGGNGTSFVGTNGTANGWTVYSNTNNASAPFPTTNVLQLTDNTSNPGNEVRDAFSTTEVPVSNGFTATFTYTPSGNKGANGVAFILQNDPRRASAIGASGGQLGFGGITNSVGALINIYTGSSGGIGIPTTLDTDGGLSAYQSVSPLVLNGGDPINVTLVYNTTAATLTEVLADPTGGTTFTKVYSGVNLPSVLGSNSAYVGFGGSDGGVYAIQQISNFSYSTNPLSTTYINNVALTGGAVATIDVAANSANPTITMGTLAVGNGTGTQLNVTGSTVAAGQAYGLTLGATTLAGNVVINVANNTGGSGNALGTLTLGAVGQTGGTWGISTGGPGTLVLGGANTYTGTTTVAGGTLLVNGSPPASRESVPWRAILRSGNLWWLCGMYFCLNVGWCFHLTYLPSYLPYRFHLGQQSVLGAIYSGGPLWLGAAGCLLGGLVADRLLRRAGNPVRLRKRLCSASLVLAGLSWLAAIFATNVHGLALAVALAAFFNDLTMPSAWAVCQNIGGRYAGIAAACMNTIGTAGGAVAIWFTGMLVEHSLALRASTLGIAAGRLSGSEKYAASIAGYDWGLAVFALAYLLAAACWWWIDPTQTIVSQRH